MIFSAFVLLDANIGGNVVNHTTFPANSYHHFNVFSTDFYSTMRWQESEVDYFCPHVPPINTTFSKSKMAVRSSPANKSEEKTHLHQTNKDENDPKYGI